MKKLLFLIGLYSVMRAARTRARKRQIEPRPRTIERWEDDGGARTAGTVN